jgi:hypothetical protein
MLDIMHVEQNISDNLLNYLFSEKDIVETWRDMEKVGVQH